MTDAPGTDRTPADKADAPSDKVRQAELAISLVLRIGVGLSVALAVAGLVVVFVHQGANHAVSSTASFHVYARQSTPFPRSVSALVRAVGHGDGRGIIELGLVVLILTPILRVVVGVVSFLYEGDRRMALITLFVLVVLIGSFVVGGAA